MHFYFLTIQLFAKVFEILLNVVIIQTSNAYKINVSIICRFLIFSNRYDYY